MQDTHVFDFMTMTWSEIVASGAVPASRDSHIAVVFNDCMYIQGGSTGNPMGDFHELGM